MVYEIQLCTLKKYIKKAGRIKVSAGFLSPCEFIFHIISDNISKTSQI